MQVSEHCQQAKVHGIVEVTRDTQMSGHSQRAMVVSVPEVALLASAGVRKQFGGSLNVILPAKVYVKTSLPPVRGGLKTLELPVDTLW